MSENPESAKRREEENEIIRKLKTALRTDGDFPVRAKVVSELRSLVNNPNTSVSQITEVILREAALGTRVLHLVNSAYYQRARPIMTVSQAVVQLGMQPLSELCTSLVLLQRFIPAAQRGGIFAVNMKQNILTAILSSALARETKEPSVAERGYLAGTFFNLGMLLLAYYFPQVFDVAEKRAVSRKRSLKQSLTEVIGVSPVELSVAIVEALDIPHYYLEIIAEAHKTKEERELTGPDHALAMALAAADSIAETIVNKKSIDDLNRTLSDVGVETDFTGDQLTKVLKELPEAFDDHCRMIEMGFLELPDYVREFAEEEQEEIVIIEPLKVETLDGESADFARYIEEIREAIDNSEPLSSIITSVMETLAFCLHFDRVLLLLSDSENTVLRGRMSLGQNFPSDPREMRQNLESPREPVTADIEAFRKGTVQVFGEPLFDDGWPFAAISIGGATEPAVGIVYADIISSIEDDVEPLSERTEASLALLADLLDRAVQMNA